MRRARATLTLSLVLCAAIAACGGSGVQGEYVGKTGESFFDSLTFRSDGKVDVVLIGVRHEGSYEADGNQVTITAPNGDRTPFQLDASGCLTHPVAGTYCKGGNGGSSAPPATDATRAGGSFEPPGASDVSGAEVYEARAREGQIRLELGGARKARITMVPTGIADAPERMSFDVSYASDGGAIRIDLPGGEPLTLTRAGSDLEGTMNGETVRFVRR